MSRWKLIWVSIGLGIIYWTVDILSDVFIFNEGTISQQIISPEPPEVVARLFVSLFVIVFGIYVQHLINKQRRIQKTLIGTEGQYRLLFHNSPVGIFTYDAHLQITDCNNRFIEILKSSREKIIGLDMNTLKDRSVLPCIQKAVEGEEGIYEGFYRATTGPAEIWISMHTAPVFDSTGKVKGGIAIANDITAQRLMEMSLQRSRVQYKNLFNSMRDVVVVADMERNVLDANQPALRNLFGYELEDVIGKSARIFYADEEGYQFTGREIFEKKESTEGKIFKVDCRRKNGEVFKGEIFALKLLDEKGTPIGNIGIYRDITEQRIAEEKFINERNFSETVINSLPGIFYVLTDKGKFVRWNKNVEKVSGYSAEEVELMSPLDFFEGKDKEIIEDRIREVFTKGAAIADATLTSKNGQKTPYLFTGQRLAIANTSYLVGMGIDLSERKQMEEILFQVTQDWQDTFNSITDMVTVHDKDFNIIHANNAAEKILGLPLMKDLTERKCFRFYHGTESAPAGCPSCSCLKTGKAATFELFEPHLNMHIEIRAIPRFDTSHNIIGLVHVVRDITERKKLEAQLQQSQKMEAVGTLTGGIAHDFNNILTAIIGYGNILKMKLEQESPLLPYTDQILASAERAANLTQSLLAFSRKQVINPKPVNLSETTASIEKILLRIIGEDIELKTILSGMRDLRVMADAGQIEQVLMNLAVNARDAMSEGGTLTIETGLEELDMDFLKIHEYGKPGMYAMLTVTDTGHGMDEMTRQRIFEPFFTTKEVGKGTGLGLSMVYGIIKQHSGYINCYSEPGTGTTFRIYLPVIESETEKAKKEEHITLSGGTETILLAEDEEEVRKLMKLVLEETGYKVIEAVDGKEAIEKFRENKDRITLLLLDVIMPKINGKGVYEEAKKIKPDIKALFSSGYPADFIHKKGILEEGLNFISKPASPHELLKRIREVLDK